MNNNYTMDTIIQADENLCINCGSCIRACPGGHLPHGTFVLGYPAEKYHRIPTRKPLDVTWR